MWGAWGVCHPHAPLLPPSLPLATYLADCSGQRVERGRSGRLRLRVGEAYPLKGKPSIGDGDPGVTAVGAQLDLGRVRVRVKG